MKFKKTYDHLFLEPSEKADPGPLDLSFCGFLRHGDTLHIIRSDIVFKKLYMKMLIEESKTDVYRKGNRVYIAKRQCALCPVQNLKFEIFVVFEI